MRWDFVNNYLSSHKCVYFWICLKYIFTQVNDLTRKWMLMSSVRWLKCPFVTEITSPKTFRQYFTTSENVYVYLCTHLLLSDSPLETKRKCLWSFLKVGINNWSCAIRWKHAVGKLEGLYKLYKINAFWKSRKFYHTF